MQLRGEKGQVVCECESTLECNAIAGDYSSLGMTEGVLMDKSYSTLSVLNR